MPASGDTSLSAQNAIASMTAQQSWEALADDAEAQLVDVRTSAEWTFVGVPDLSALGRKPILIEWQGFPAMQVNAGFAETLAGMLSEAGFTETGRLFFLCRSGGRSLAAASTMAAHGFENCINVSDGFEGDPNGDGHRGKTNGWKASDLPWRQT